MRVADSLTLPSELVRALAADELVVFAGAGVSMGAPANLPGFAGLARQIAEPKIPWDASYEKSLDRYLGRAAREGVKVQERARAFLESQGTHTPLHEHLLGIFGAPERIRLVTTNFDHHFTTAASRLFPGANIPRYVGPALPPGARFSGIAQLHGALDQTQDRLVLTDADFADAYMADGWAARFLVRVFANRTVLFVGYSLGDPLMQYLLHAIPPQGRWYALWRESEISQGADHSIIPIPFRAAANGDEFGDLNDGMQRWHWYAAAAASDHDRKLRGLIAVAPPASPLDADYVRARLSTEAGRIAFWSAATDEAWFDWVASEGFLDALTDESGSDGVVARWARWCLSHYCGGDAPRLLRFLRGRPLSLHPWFLEELVRHLWITKPWPPRPVLRQLIALVVSQPIASVRDSLDWQWLLGRLCAESCYEEAIALLRLATRVRLLPVERLQLAFESDDGEQKELPSLSIRIGTCVGSAEIEEFLSKHGAELAAAAPEALRLLSEQRIVEAYELLDLARGANGNMDWLSFGRAAIAPSNQDRLSHGEDVLVMLVRIVLDHYSLAAPAQLQSFGERYENSNRNLFRRLALYAYAKSTVISPEQVLARATAHGWAREVWLRPEFYLLLGAHYGSATENAKGEFVAVLGDDGWWGEAIDKYAAHARFSISQKLLREAPDSPATQDFAKAQAEAHPEWRESDPDGLLSRVEVGWSGEEPSAIQADQMLQMAPAEACARLVAELQQGSGEAGGRSLLGAVQQAVRSRAIWGVELVHLVMDGDEQDQRIAEAALWGLREASMSFNDKLKLLHGIVSGKAAQSLTATLGSLVNKWSEDLGKTAEPELLDALDDVADLVYQRSSLERPAIEDHGWTERAINHPAGNAASVWWHVASARDWTDGQFVLTLDNAERARWASVVNGGSGADAFARPIAGMATDRLSSGDFPWSTQVIFPAFDAKADPARAAQLWDGRLMQTRWSWSSLEGVAPYVDSLLAESANLVPARSRQLGEWVAMLVADADKTHVTTTQLQRFIQGATQEARIAFAGALPRHLDRIDADGRKQLWQELLAPYWRDRRTNMPLPLASEEVREMISWVMALTENADEALAALQGSPGERIAHADQIIWKWKEDDAWVSSHPRVAAGVVEFLSTRHSISIWLADSAVAILEKALEAGAPRDTVTTAAESLVALPCPPAAALVARLRTSD